MIRFNWRRKSDGEPLTRISVSHTLTRDGLAQLLIVAKAPWTAAELTEMSKTAVERAIRMQLERDPSAADCWGDEYAEQYDHEVTQDQAWEWAKRQVAKL
jgi:hypothetical protein